MWKVAMPDDWKEDCASCAGRGYMMQDPTREPCGDCGGAGRVSMVLYVDESGPGVCAGCGMPEHDGECEKDDMAIDPRDL